MAIPTLSKIASKLVFIKGKLLNLKDFELFKPFYNSKTANIVLKTGRQVGKSTGLAVKQVIRACIKSYSLILTLLPLSQQTDRFSRLYIDNIFRESPDLYSRISSNLVNTIGLKQLNNGSELHFSYIGDNPDRVRGISVKDANYDEVQDIICDHIPIASQCTRHFSDSRYEYSGTPKTLDNTLEGLWINSCQYEPLVRCSRCHFDNFCVIPDVYKMLIPTGLSCQKCGRVLPIEDIVNIQYSAFNPMKIGIYDGYHIPQIFVRYNLNKERWAIVMDDYSNFSQATFANEVLGISFDTGGRPVTQEKLLSCCTERSMGEVKVEDHYHRVMGIDWGYATSNSLTVVTVVGVRSDGKYDVLFAKKYRYRDRLEQIAELCQLYKDYICCAVGCDAGVGLTDNLILREKLGMENIYEFQYCAPNKMLRYDEDTCQFITNRTKTLGLLFLDLNKGKILFPKAEDSMDFFKDILSLREQVRTSVGGRKKYYDRNPSIPDDFAHALNFAILTAKLLTKESILDTIINTEENYI